MQQCTIFKILSLCFDSNNMNITYIEDLISRSMPSNLWTKGAILSLLTIDRFIFFRYDSFKDIEPFLDRGNWFYTSVHLLTIFILLSIGSRTTALTLIRSKENRESCNCVSYDVPCPLQLRRPAGHRGAGARGQRQVKEDWVDASSAASHSTTLHTSVQVHYDSGYSNGWHRVGSRPCLWSLPMRFVYKHKSLFQIKGDAYPNSYKNFFLTKNTCNPYL